MTPCHSQKYAEALKGMQQFAARMWQGSMPPWGQAAIEQHAHYYASKACGELDMPLYNNSVAMRGALGITRSGDVRTGRTYSLQGFAGAATDTSLYADRHQCDKAAFEAEKAAGGPGWSSYCNCMFPEGTPGRQACYEVAKGGFLGIGALKPWSCEGKLAMQVKGANVFEDARENEYCVNVVAKKIEESVETAKQYATGTRPDSPYASAAQEQTQPADPAATSPAALRDQLMTSIREGALKNAIPTNLRAGMVERWGTIRGRIPGTDRDTPAVVEKSSNTPLIVGGIAAVAVAFFLLKK